MPHDTPLISTIAVGLGLAFLLGLLAHRVKLPPIIGYLLAGIVVGPFTPGFVADQKLADQLAEIGVILLMFGVGLHFSLKDLLSVRAIAIPGAVGQIAVATMLGLGLALLLGWSVGAGIVFGLALSVASTVVLLRALQERRQIETEKGKIAVGWLIVEDLVMVITLVLVPPLAGILGGTAPVAGEANFGLASALGLGPIWATLLVTAAKIALFVGVMLIVGRRVIPWVLHFVAHTGSRELFRLAVLAIALGVAFGSAKLFGVSVALGAFFAGMVLAESQLSTQAAKETLPLRDAFAVLFFVSVGMLFNPAVLVTAPLAVLAVVLIIVVGKSLAAFLIVRAFGHPSSVALTIAASLAQIGEFSFILIVLAVDLSIVSTEARDLVVAGSILSILLNPLIFMLIDRMGQPKAAPGKADGRADGMTDEAPAAASAEPSAAPAAEPTSDPDPEEAPTALDGHTILVGHGRVGSHIAEALAARAQPFLVVENDTGALESLKATSIEHYAGTVGEERLTPLLGLERARCLLVAIPDPFEAGHAIEVARKANPALRIIARAHSAEGMAYLSEAGADLVLMGEEELARSMAANIETRQAVGGNTPAAPEAATP